MDQTNSAEDWELLKTFFPPDWRALARSSGALKGLRQDKDEESYLRTLLMHVGCGYSLRETVVRAKKAGLADLSDVALLKRLRKSKDWLYGLCCSLFEERGMQAPRTTGPALCLVDATQVKEPGQTGSLWRIHYSLRWPSLMCQHFKLTPSEGAGSGETLQQFPFRRNDHVLADRGYSVAGGIHHVAQRGAFLTVRLNPCGIRLRSETGGEFPLLKRLAAIRRTGQIATWPVLIPWEKKRALAARICVIRKSKEAIALAEKKLRRKASKNGTALQEHTLIYARYVMVLTTFEEGTFPAELVLEWYRVRWQVELVFKRFKQIVGIGHLPKYDDESAKAWLYGKMVVALLTEKIIAHARALSPWGYALEATSPSQQVA